MKLQKSSAAALMVALGISATFAQQLPNPGFEDNWDDCLPWASVTNPRTKGQTPKPWCISNVVSPGVIGNAGDVTPYEKTTGNNSNTAIRLFNKSTFGQVIPGYITLGTTWATACVKGFSPVNGTMDGGTWGYYEFAYKPDALAFDYIHANGKNSTQPASAIAYMWNGETTQIDVPANNVYNATKVPTATKITMTNRDRNVFGLNTILGGTVTKSDDFELIATIDHKITEINSEWATMEIPFEYKSDATPSKINVILAAGDYFADRSDLKGDDALTVDNVKLIYYSRLSALSVNGVAVPDFAEDKYEYTVDVPYSREAALEYAVKGKSANAEVAYDDDNYTATVKVSNVDADSDGEASHSYVVKFAEPTATGTTYEGTITIFLNKIGLGDEPLKLDDQKVVITSTGDNTCDFALYNFTLDGTQSLGNIIVKDVKITKGDNGKLIYTGAATDLSLAEGEIIADAELNGVEDADHNLVMKITVKWYPDPSDKSNAIDIDVEFKTNNYDVTTGIDDIINDSDNAAPRYFMLNGVEVKDATAPGLYIVRRGNTVSKVLVK